jgi:tetratricopeptide (TPR) repeat protein
VAQPEDSVADLRLRLETALADRYLIERELGRGGMAVVYLAQDLRHKRQVALKALLPDIAVLLGPDRFLREIEITAQLQHPNIVPVHDSGNVEGTLFYVMPYVEGESLRDRLNRSKQLLLDDVVQLVREVADALRYAHGRGVIHRDIKPENILLSAGHAQIADFGIARAVEAAGGTSLTRTGGILGTPAYMAPEQAAGLPDVDGRADLYSLAAVAHECLVGSRGEPMSSVRSSESTLMTGRPDVGPRLARALSAPLALERDARPASVENWLGMLGQAQRRPRSTRVWAAGAIVGAALAVVAWLVLRPPGPAPEPDLRRIAMFPTVISGTGDTAFETALVNAFEQQLLYLPGAELVRDSIRASELLRVRARLAPDSQVDLNVRVLTSAGRDIANAQGEGRADRLPTLVATVLGEVYAAQIAEERIGWSQALPQRMDTWLDYLQGERNFRSGNFIEATRRFERVIEREPSYAPAHFKRMLTEVLRSRPTRAMIDVERALAAARAFRDSLDPTTRDLLAGYDILMGRGDLDSALATFAGIVDRNPRAIDAWFVLGFLKMYFAGLLRQPPTVARFDFERAHALDPNFAPVLVQLARIAFLVDNSTLGKQYTRAYLALDSVSDIAELLRMADSALGSVGTRIELFRSLEDRPTTVLENVALLSGAVDQPYQGRLASRVAGEALWQRATTPAERKVAFRLHMATTLGSARYASADSLMRLGRRAAVPSEELDAWLLLPAVTVNVALGTDAERAAAAQRLAERSDDATALWLAARWYRGRAPAQYRTVVRRLEALIATRPDTVPLERGLLLDLRAGDALARGDTMAALSAWSEATSRYTIGEVTFGLAGSFWPIELERARVAAGAGDHEGVLIAARHFRYMAGFVDQVTWPVIWPLAIEAHQASGDPLAAREVAALIEPVLRDANGDGTVIHDAVAAAAQARQ